MIGKIVLAALIAGMLAGLALAGIQHVRLSPLIAQGEIYEMKAEAPAPATTATGAKPKCVENMPGMKMCPDDGSAEWEPAEGFQRTAFTTVASLLAGGGFAHHKGQWPNLGPVRIPLCGFGACCGPTS